MREVHYMVDIECLSCGYQAMVTSIGAVEFDLETHTLGRTFKRNIAMQSSEQAGFNMQADTVAWWFGQSEEARKAMIGDATHVMQTFDQFSHFLRFDGYEETAERLTPVVWGNGSNFDNRILREGFELLKMPCPWSFRHDRDMRTYVAEMARHKITIGRNEIPNPLKHDALEDAKYQARVMIALDQRFKERFARLGMNP
jgi:exodeoxyribonuclease VIII